MKYDGTNDSEFMRFYRERYKYHAINLEKNASMWRDQLQADAMPGFWKEGQREEHVKQCEFLEGSIVGMASRLAFWDTEAAAYPSLWRRLFRK